MREQLFCIQTHTYLLFHSCQSCENIEEFTDGINDERLFCRRNPSAPNVRFYDVTVTATDSAGNNGSDTCRIVIISSCSNGTPNCDRFREEGDFVENFYYSRDFVDEAVAAQLQEAMYKTDAKELVWVPDASGETQLTRKRRRLGEPELQIDVP